MASTNGQVRRRPQKRRMKVRDGVTRTFYIEHGNYINLDLIARAKGWSVSQAANAAMALYAEANRDILSMLSSASNGGDGRGHE